MSSARPITVQTAADPHGVDVRRALWTGLGLLSLGVGLVGAVLPVLPTTVFVLGAAACFAKGSPRWERRLLEHPRLGPTIRAWRAERAIPPRARVAALLGMAAAAAVVAFTAPPTVAASVAVVLVPVALFVGTRPAPSLSACDRTVAGPR